MVIFIWHNVYIAKDGTQPKCPSAAEWMNKLGYNKIEYSALKGMNKLQSQTTMLSLTSVMLSQTNQIFKKIHVACLNLKVYKGSGLP